MNPTSDILRLVETFDRNIEAYKSGRYNETEVRIQFINPLFELLGWDVENRQGHAEAYKDVVHEDAIKVEGAAKAPDYSFRIGGTRKFFLEAKKPSISIKDDINPAFQLRRYAWSAKLPLSILTDFEEFAVYDCRVKPLKTDKPSTARVCYLHYKDYPDRWDEIASIFSREAVLKGLFDKYAGSIGGKRGTADVDVAFLTEVESWRDMLARNIALRNPKITQRELNFAVQMTIDRIIFLRICEDRGIEDYGRLMALLNEPQIYQRLCKLFRDADDRYNSGLFHFRKEKDRPTPPDDLTLRLTVDDKPLKEIFRNLYYPESPYEFSVLPADILGQVYEQFLGKVIRLTSGHHAVVEYKPEVKKAGGVYYTPTYIVDYIVKNTVGELLEGKKPGPRGGVSKLKILDPACGSGSFLIGAYQYLLDWHRDKYVEDGPKRHKEELYQVAGGEWRLTTAERKRILLNNIYGVDIDPQAVEVTKLSLLLKVLEGESSETLNRQLHFFHERALPDLGNNIKCGNSLIGPDFYNNQQISLLDEEEQYRINVFDWQTEFPEIMKTGGFDVVIGNPPYVFGGNIGINKIDKIYFKRSFFSGTGKINLFTLFIEKSINIIRNRGLVSFIIPNTFLRVTSYERCRELVLKKTSLKRVLDLGADVFEKVTTSAIVIVLERSDDPTKNEVKIYQGIEANPRLSKQVEFLNQGFVINIRSTTDELKLLLKLNNKSIHLGQLCDELIFGVVISKNQDKVVSKEKKSNYKPFLEGKDISRYFINPINKYLYYKPELLHRPRTPGIFEAQEKLLIQRITGGKRPLHVAYDNNQLYNKESINNLLLRDHSRYSIKYILGLLNSVLINWFYKTRFTNESMLTVNISKTYLSQIPIRTINFNNPKEKAMHDKVVSLVECMLDLNKELSVAKTDHEKTALKRQIDSTDRQIDNLVYELYGLTEEEIAIVEGAVNEAEQLEL